MALRFAAVLSSSLVRSFKAAFSEDLMQILGFGVGEPEAKEKKKSIRRRVVFPVHWHGEEILFFGAEEK
jgi:hypothetical protein